MINPWLDHSAAIPGVHTVTGSDHIASFSRKGKVRPLALLEKNQNAIERISKLGEDEVINGEQCADAENLCVLCIDKRNYPLLPKLVSKCSLRSISLKLEKIYLLCKKDGWQFFASMFPSYFAETKKDKLPLQCLA